MNWPYSKLNIRTIPRHVFVTVPSCHVHHVEVAIVVVVLAPSPNLGTANLIAFTFLGATSKRFSYNSYKPSEEPMAYLDPPVSVAYEERILCAPLPPKEQQNVYFSDYLPKIFLMSHHQEIVERDCRLPQL